MWSDLALMIWMIAVFTTTFVLLWKESKKREITNKDGKLCQEEIKTPQE